MFLGHGSLENTHIRSSEPNLRTRVERRKIMKEDIQPKYEVSHVTCNCGNTFETRSTKGDIHVEICSKCHPFYTGQQKASAARGAIEKFNRKYGLA